MMQNEYRNEEIKSKKPAKKKRKRAPRESRVGKALRSVLDGSILTRENAVRLVPFVIFLTLICVFYIANSHYADKTLRKSAKTRKEIDRLEVEYLSTESEKTMCNQQSTLAELLDTTGVSESVVPPKKIFVKPE